MSLSKFNAAYYPIPSAGLIMVAHYQLVHHHSINVPSPIGQKDPQDLKKRRQPIKKQQPQIVNGVCVPLYTDIPDEEMNRLTEIYVEAVLENYEEKSLDMLIAISRITKEEFYEGIRYVITFNNMAPEEIFDLIIFNRYFIDDVMIPYGDIRANEFIIEAMKNFVDFNIVPDDSRNICDLNRCIGDECTYRHDDSSPCVGDDCDFHHKEMEDSQYLCDRDGYVYDPFLNEENVLNNDHMMCTGKDCDFHHVESDDNQYVCESNGYMYYR